LRLLDPTDGQMRIVMNGNITDIARIRPSEE
jgi:hypothetical protein